MSHQLQGSGSQGVGVNLLRLVVSAVIVFGSVAAVHAQAADIRIVAPYVGFVTNVTERETDGGDVKLEDTDLMLGIYAQWIRPGDFQGNVFLYHAPDVNYSKLWGFHSNFDRYFAIGEIENLVVGGGLELISIDLDAGDSVSGLQDFSLRTTVIAPFLRVGKQIPFAGPRSSVVIFPWVGGEVDFVSGQVSLQPDSPFPVPKITRDIKETDLYALAGINVRATLWRFIQIDGKYSGAFDPGIFLPRASVMANVFFTRRMGFSYRFSAMESTAGSTLYHIFGAAFVF